MTDALGRAAEIAATICSLSPAAAASAAGVAPSASAFAGFVAAVGSAAAPSAFAATGVAPPIAGPGALSGEDIVAAARRYEGVPYVFGGADASGIDCSGLVYRALQDAGMADAPRRLRDQAAIGTTVPSLAQARPGDIIATRDGGHIVIYAGDGMVVHAPYAGRTVSYQRNWLTDADIGSIRRVAPSKAEFAAPGVPTAPASPSVADAAALAQWLLSQNQLAQGVGR